MYSECDFFWVKFLSFNYLIVKAQEKIIARSSISFFGDHSFVCIMIWAGKDLF